MTSKKVLIVEDDKFIHTLLSMKLSAKGFVLVSAENGPAALELSVKEMPDVVLLDIMLPGMSGFEILQKMKVNPETKKIPVIIFSNLSSQSDIDKVFELGAAQFFVKANTTPDKIAQVIEKQIQASEALTAPQEHSPL